jgi:hypothetical protein
MADIFESDRDICAYTFCTLNYVSLVPGESKKMIVKFSSKDLGSDEPVIKIQGYNLEGPFDIQDNRI